MISDGGKTIFLMFNKVETNFIYLGPITTHCLTLFGANDWQWQPLKLLQSKH